MEGMAIRSPRKVKQRSWSEKAKDWPSNLVLSLETSFQLLSLDPAGYPLAIALNAVHFLTRLSVFTAALPSWGGAGGGRKSARDLADADARLEALRRQAKAGAGGALGWKLVAFVSILLVLISFGNAAYLFTRRRRYHLILRQDPLASPNARTTTLDFSPPRPELGLVEKLKKRAYALIWTPEEEERHEHKVQELDIWTPEYVKWSLRLFSLYPPPLALMHHFLTPSNFFPFILCGSVLVLQTFLLVQFFSQLILDRRTLQSEVMHEYNANFVHPRIFVQKHDVGTSTDELEFVAWKLEQRVPPSASRSGRKPREEYEAPREYEVPMEEGVRGSGGRGMGRDGGMGEDSPLVAGSAARRRRRVDG